MQSNFQNLSDQYRDCVGVMLLNQSNQVFIAQRLDTQNHYWQMPQGGVEFGENYITAGFRELEEEIGVNKNKVQLIAEMPDLLYYDFPSSVQKKAYQGKFLGQKQKWFLMKFIGKDGDIDINYDKTPEFRSWKWEYADLIISLCIPFKQATYKSVYNYFQKYLGSNYCDSNLDF